MTEFFQPTTHVRADGEWVSYVHRLYRTYSNRRRTFKLNPSVTHSVDKASSEMFIAPFMNMCERIFSEGQASFKTGHITEEQIAKVRILNEKNKKHHNNVDAP